MRDLSDFDRILVTLRENSIQAIIDKLKFVELINSALIAIRVHLKAVNFDHPFKVPNFYHTIQATRHDVVFIVAALLHASDCLRVPTECVHFVLVLFGIFVEYFVFPRLFSFCQFALPTVDPDLAQESRYH